MKAKVTRGSGFAGAIRYALDEGTQATGDKEAEIVGGTIASRNATGIAREFAITRQLKPKAKRPVWHCSLSLPAGERLTAENWAIVCSDFMQKMQFPEDTLWTAVRHNDTDYDHVHIIASRISLSGNLWHGQWEARRAIEATQELERIHGLTLTPGLGGVETEQGPPHTRLTMQELSKSERLGLRPARDVIVEAIEEVLAHGDISLSEFVRRLREEHEVFVVANVAKTGRLSGLSFEHEGLAFSGSKLASASSYGWAKLQKRGVNYEQSRDSEEVAYARGVAADRAAAARDDGRLDRAADRDSGRSGDTDRGPGQRHDGAAAGVGGSGSECDPGHERYGGHLIESANSDSERAIELGGIGREPGQGPDCAAPDPGHVIEGCDGQPGAAADRDHGGPAQGRGAATADLGGAAGEREGNREGIETTETDRGRDGDDEGRSGGPNEEQNMAINFGNRRERPTERSIDSSGANVGWNTRFKRASAAKRASGAEPGPGRRVGEGEIAIAQQIDPSRMLESAGFIVRHEGRHLSVRHPAGDEVYRITKMPDGRYISCDRYQNGIGDNIALARDLEPGLSFPDAVYRLTGGQSMREAVIHAEKPPIAPPRLPRPSAADVAAGRKYLQGRGIDAQTLADAEKAGFLRYAPGAVVYVGQDKEGKVRAATRRAVDPADQVQKRDFKGTNKYYPGILPGSPRNVVIVEGGADALALHSMAKRRNQEPPTVIVSGGSNVLSFLKNQETRRLLMQAEAVTIATEREKNAQVQAEVDAARAKQISEVQSITRAPVSTLDPAPGCKDVSEQNQFEAEKTKTTPPPAAPPTPPASRYSNFSRPKG